MNKKEKITNQKKTSSIFHLPSSIEPHLPSSVAHHKHVQKLYEELLADVPGITVHKQPAGETMRMAA